MYNDILDRDIFNMHNKFQFNSVEFKFFSKRGAIRFICLSVFVCLSVSSSTFIFRPRFFKHSVRRSCFFLQDAYRFPSVIQKERPSSLSSNPNLSKSPFPPFQTLQTPKVPFVKSYPSHIFPFLSFLIFITTPHHIGRKKTSKS